MVAFDLLLGLDLGWVFVGFGLGWICWVLVDYMGVCIVDIYFVEVGIFWVDGVGSVDDLISLCLFLF